MLRNFKCFVGIGLFILLTLSTGSAAEKIQESITSLGIIPKEFEIINESLKYSPDFRHVSYVAFADPKTKIVCFDNKTSPVYEAVRPGFPLFAPETNRHAYIAYNKGNKAVCVVDLQSGPEFDNIDQFLFSSDGSRFAYRAAKNGKQCIVIDGKPGPLFKGIPVNNNMAFSPDSKHFAYVALTDGGCTLIFDGKRQSETFNFIQDITFSPDSTQIAYKARIEKTGKTEKWQVVLNGSPGPAYDKLFDLVFSLDSKRLAYPAVKNQKMVLVIDGVETEPHDMYGLPVFSPDSQKIAYVYTENAEYHFVINGKEQNVSFDKFYKFYYSPDSSKYAYIANKDDHWHCVYKGNLSPPYKIIDGLKFSPDSSKYAYGAATKEGGKVVVNGKPGKTYQTVGEPYFSPNSLNIVHKAVITEKGKWTTIWNGKDTGKFYDTIGKYFFSDDSRHLAYSAMKNPLDIVMVVDDQEQCPNHQFKIVGDPYFSPDGNHVVYYAMLKKEKWKLVVDGHLLEEEYGGFIKTTPIVFDSENKFHTLAIRMPGPEFVRINVEIPEDMKLETEIQ